MAVTLTREDFHRLLFEQSPDGIIVSDPNGQLVDVNPVICKILGYSCESLLAKTAEDLFLPSDLEADPLRYKHVASGEAILKQRRMVTASGDLLPVEVNARKMPDGRILIIIRDISERIKAEEELQFQSFLLDKIHDRITATDLEGRIVYVNDAELRMLKRTRQELIGQYVGIYGSDHSKGATQEEIVQTVREKGFWHGQVMNYTKEGKTVLLDSSVSLVNDADGKPTMMIGIGREITKQKQKEEKFKVLAEMLDAAPNSITVHDQQGKFLYANKKTFEIHQYTAEEFMALNLHELDAPESADLIETRIHQIYQDGSASFEVGHMLKDGSVIPMEVFAKQVEWFGQDVFLSIATDISERKKTEAELRDSESRYRLVAENSQDVIWLWDLDQNRYVFISPAVKRLRGFTVEEAMKQTFFDALPETYHWLITDELPTRIAAMESGDRNARFKAYELEQYCKDGHLVQTEVSTTLIADKHGKVTHLQGVARDITEHKLAERLLNIAKEAAEESSKLKTAFLNNISHEVRTPMNAIMGFTELLQSNDFSDTEKSRFMNIILTNAAQLLSIIDDVLEISRLDSGRIPLTFASFSLPEFMNEIHISMTDLVKTKGLRFYYTVDHEHTTTRITADMQKIRQVITGLITNSVKFTHQGSIHFGYWLKDGSVQFYVSDTGIGIDHAEQSRIFDRFYQVVQEGAPETRGTGLGLSIAKSIVELMGGEIRVESESGRGSTFFVTVPYQEVITESSAEMIKRAINLSDISVLIAEDDVTNFEYLKIILSRKVKSVAWASNGEEAVDLVDTKRPDIVLMDLKMPGMNGLEATKKIRVKYPDLPIIALTAYTQPEEESEAMAAGCDAFSSKPVRKDELLDLISRILQKH